MRNNYFLTALLYLLLVGQPISSINVALHAQAKYSEHGWVAGSEVTTAGIKNALVQHGQISKVHIFAPFSYLTLNDTRWDLAIIEGYIGSVPTFIRRLRSINPKIKIIHYCLDTYPTLDHIINLDVDGFFTNSKVLLPRLVQLAPAQYVPLAADPHAMRPMLRSNKYKNHTVVYLGHNSMTKPNLHRMLREAIPFGLIIYGHNWIDAPDDLKARWRGVLPLNDVAELYSAAKIVIGTTEGKQQRLGMINNRVYEVLSCGSVLVSDAFEMIEQEFGDGPGGSTPENNVIYFDRKPGDTTNILHRLLTTTQGETERHQRGAKGRQRIVNHESWKHRIITMLDMYDSLLKQDNHKVQQHMSVVRPLRPVALVVGRLTKEWLQQGFQTAHEREFRVSYAQDFKAVKDHELLAAFALIVVVGQLQNNKFQHRVTNGLRAPSLWMEHGPEKTDSRRDRFGLLCKKMYVADTTESTANQKMGDKQHDPVVYDVVFNTAPQNNANRKELLVQHMMTAVLQPRKSSQASLTVSTEHQKRKYAPGETIRFQVHLFDFVAPDHGMWCVRVNGVEIRCIGDGQSYIDIVVAATQTHPSTMSIQTVLRTHIDRTIFQQGITTQYPVEHRVPMTEIVTIDNVQQSVEFYDDRTMYSQVKTFCNQHQLTVLNCHQLTKQIALKTPNAKKWKDRIDRKIHIGYVISMENDWQQRQEKKTQHYMKLALALDPELYTVIFFVIGTNVLNRSMDWIKQLIKYQMVVVHLEIPKEVTHAIQTALAQHSQDHTNNHEHEQEHHEQVYASLNEQHTVSLQYIMDAFRGLDFIEFVANKELCNECLVISTAVMNVGVLEIKEPHNISLDATRTIEWYNTFTNAKTFYQEGTLKIPPLSLYTVVERDRSGVFYYQQGQKLTKELDWKRNGTTTPLPPLPPPPPPPLPQQEVHLVQALPLFNRRVRLHRGVPFNEWLTAVEWHDEHNPIIQAILAYRYEKTTRQLIGASKRIWNQAPIHNTTGHREFEYPKQTGWWPGVYRSRGNFFVTAKHKLHHDAEQFKYNVLHGYLPSIFNQVADNYTVLLERFESKKMNEYIYLHEEDLNVIGTTYNFMNYIHPGPILEYPDTALSMTTNFKDAEQTYFSASNSPGLAVIDDFLSKKALQSLLTYLMASTIWFDVKNGYLGTYMNSGLATPILGQIETELRLRMPTLIGTHPLKMVWAYKCFESVPEGLALHADDAVVNLNLWLTPDEANLDQQGTSGGLIVHLTQNIPPLSFKQMNRLSEVDRIKLFLKESQSQRVEIPYRQNRAVIFHSNLYHETSPFRFKKGYANSRINLTFLFGSKG